MSVIITITPNPCIDISTHVEQLIPEKKLVCTSLKKEPGGGGINVSRVIKRFGGDSKAIYLAGGYTGDYFTKLLQAESVETIVIKTQNHTRENFIVAEESSKRQYRFGMPGPVIQEEEWMKCLEMLDSMNEAFYIVASGSLTTGIPLDFFARLAVIAKHKNIRLVLDTSGAALTSALEAGVYMIKPNLGELSFISGVKELDRDSAVEAARIIITKKQCEVVVVSMGAGGALLVTAEITEHVIAPPVEVKSTVGAGDSMVAGIVLSLANNKSFKEALEFGVACGTATTMKEGTALCDEADVRHLLKLIK